MLIYPSPSDMPLNLFVVWTSSYLEIDFVGVWIGTSLLKALLQLYGKYCARLYGY